MKQLMILCLWMAGTAVSQTNSGAYDTDLLPASFHAQRRQALREKMADNSVAVVFAGPERNRSNDVDFVYKQDPSFFYLTGFTSPNAVLLVFKTPQTIDSVLTDEVLLIEPKDPDQERWTGRRLSVDEVKKGLGIKAAIYTDRGSLSRLKYGSYAKVYHSFSYDDVRDDKMNPYDLFDLLKTFKEKTAALNNLEPNKFYRILCELREVKTPEELTLLRKAIDISCDAHLNVMRQLKPDMTEYQAQAIAEYGFKYGGAEDVGYPSIVGAGENGCVAHYITNRKKFEKNDLLVIDAGAEYHGYTADITRTLPVNGRFSNEQKLIYNLELKAQEEGIKMCKAGNGFRSTHEATSAVIKKGLVELGIIKDEKDYQLYFFHGTSHYLGLDVHDIGTYGKLREGDVITVEPGIYIPEGSPCDKKWWNIGVRIEDDVLITSGEPEVLSKKLPKTIEEIEALMAAPKK